MTDTLTYTQVRDFIYQRFVKILRANAQAVIGYTPYIKWPGIEPTVNNSTTIILDGDSYETVEADGKINSDLHWVRVQVQPVENKRFGHIKTAHIETGMLSIEWFSPKSRVEGYDEMEKISQILKNSFIGKRLYGSLYFKSGLTTPLDPTDVCYRFKTLIEYRYISAVI